MNFPTHFDNSGLKSFRDCEKYGFHNLFERIVPIGQNVHLHAGKAFATGIEHFRRGFFEQNLTEQQALELGYIKLIEAYGDYTPPEYSVKTIDRMLSALVFYAERYPLTGYIEPYMIPDQASTPRCAAEFTMAVPLPIAHPITGDSIIYTGRFDLLGIYHKKQMCIMDEKTTVQLGKRWLDQWPVSSQFYGYGWGCKQMGLPADLAIVRGISILKNSHETLEVPIYLPQWQLDRWLDNTCTTIERLIKCWKDNKFSYNFSSACTAHGKCSYYTLCDSQFPEAFKPVYYEPNTWDPLDK